jgi:hypothetical protein
MDHCLTITEILSIVFENFYDTRQPKELAVLARTCQAFTGLNTFCPGTEKLTKDVHLVQSLLLTFYGESNSV